MAKEITMPLLSPSMTEGTLVKWLKKEGDVIQSGEVIAEVETDKATMDLEAFDSGVLRKILFSEGTRVPINTRIGVIGTADETIPEDLLKVEQPSAPKTEKKAPPAATPPPQKATLPPASPAPSSPTPAPASASLPPTRDRVKASPLARKLAQERGYNLAWIPGSGPEGRITKTDVLAFPGNQSIGGSLLPQGPVAPAGRQALSTMRQVIASRLLESKTTIPHFYLEVEINAEPMMKARAGINEQLAYLQPPAKLTFNDFLLKAASQAMRQCPQVNAAFDGDALIQYGDVDLAFAVAIPEGLITPIIRQAQKKTLKQISDEAKVLAQKAREGKLKPEEFQGGSLTVSNLGMLGIDRFYAIINPPQAAILSIGNLLKKPVVNDTNQIVVGHRMAIGLSCDHRVVDGAVGSQYLNAIRNLLENPATLLL